jgi:hypothetical protein
MNLDLHSFVLIIGSVCYATKVRDVKGNKGQRVDWDFGSQKPSNLGT